MDCSNLWGVRDYCHGLGFHNTYVGLGGFHAHHLAKTIRRIRCEDPECRFVFVGHSLGAVSIRNLAENLGQREGLDVALVMYLGGWMLENSPRNRPANVERVVHVLARGYDSWGEPIDGAENHKLNDVRHYGSPSHPETIDTLTRALAEVAMSITLTEFIDTEVEQLHKPPTPRPVSRQISGPRDEWDFLKPASYLPAVGERPAESNTRRLAADKK